MERLNKIENRLKQLQKVSDLEPYRDELIQIKGIINSYESDKIKVGFESSRTLEHNIQVSLEGIGAIKDAILDTLKRLWDMLFGRGSSGGGSDDLSDKVEKVKDKSKKDLNKLKKKVKSADQERKEKLARLKELNESGIPGANKEGYNLNVENYKLDIKNDKSQLNNNNPKNKILDAYSNEILATIQTEFPLLFALIGKSNVTVENFKEGLKKLGKQKQDPIWSEFKDFFNEKDNFTNREHNDLHKFIKRAEEIFGTELIPGESPISINIVSLTGKEVSILYVNKHSKTKDINKKLSFHYKTFNVSDSYVNSLKITDNTIIETDLEEIMDLVEKIDFFNVGRIKEIYNLIGGDSKRLRNNLGYPKYQQSVLEMGLALKKVMDNLKYNEGVFYYAITNLTNKYTKFIEETENFRMSKLKKDKPSIYEKIVNWTTKPKNDKGGSIDI